MTHQVRKLKEQTNDSERPDWHPFKVWQTDIRPHQPNQVVQRPHVNPDQLDATGSWTASMKHL